MARKRHSPFDVAAATAETLAHRLPVFWKGILAPVGRHCLSLAQPGHMRFEPLSEQHITVKQCGLGHVLDGQHIAVGGG